MAPLVSQSITSTVNVGISTFQLTNCTASLPHGIFSHTPPTPPSPLTTQEPSQCPPRLPGTHTHVHTNTSSAHLQEPARLKLLPDGCSGQLLSMKPRDICCSCRAPLPQKTGLSLPDGRPSFLRPLSKSEPWKVPRSRDGLGMVWGWFGEAGCGCSPEMQSLSPQPQSSLYSATSLPSCPGLPTFITPCWQPWENPNSTVASGGAVSGPVGPGRCRGHGVQDCVCGASRVRASRLGGTSPRVALGKALTLAAPQEYVAQPSVSFNAVSSFPCPTLDGRLAPPWCPVF